MDPEAPPAQAELKITWLQTGQIQVTGPISNEMLALWMLEKARDAVKAHCAKGQPLITPARMVGVHGNGG